MKITKLDEDVWEDLIFAIKQRKVIPILGNALSVVDEENKIPIHEVILQNINDEEDNDKKVRKYLREFERLSNNRMPEVFKKLAGIFDFKLFCTFATDGMMEKAIEEIRKPLGESVKSIVFATTTDKNIDITKSFDQNTIVYHFFGKVKIEDEYEPFAINDEAILEYILSFPNIQTKYLTEKLQESHLLFLGCGGSDWLLPFLIRLAKNKKLSEQREYSTPNRKTKLKEYIVDKNIANSEGLNKWFKYFNFDNSPLIQMDVFEFVDELKKRWEISSNLNEKTIKNAMYSLPFDVSKKQLEIGNYIFISYAGEDKNKTMQIVKQLESFGLPIWFDQSEILPGENYREKFTNGIKYCSLFVPIVSNTTLEVDDRYFIEEWTLAKERKRSIRKPFIIPIVIDKIDIKLVENEFNDNINICILLENIGKLNDQQLMGIQSNFIARGGFINNE